MTKIEHLQMRAACIFCKHFFFHPETGPYSDITPGEEAETGCVLHFRDCKKWILVGYWTEKDWIRGMAMAESCEDYEYIPLKEIK